MSPHVSRKPFGSPVLRVTLIQTLNACMDMYGLFTYSTQMQEIDHTLIVWVSVGMFEHEWPEWL